MKIDELLETDEWTNKEITINYLFKTQAARSVEFVRYFNRLIALYPAWPPAAISINTTVYEISREWNHADQFRQNVTRPGVLPKDVIERLMNLRERMLSAKRRFEKAGGKYNDEYTRHKL